ncbi:MAG: glycerol-3-phosphate 1-O-acyltransferase PlsY [Dehalococcoidia bacterium]
MWFVVCGVIGYLIGSLPIGLIVGRVARGIDIREYGSGKIGVTNVVRTAGIRWGVVALLADIAKGVAPVLIARLVSDDPYVQATAGLCAAVGHDFPIFAGFHGGRGVATSYGAALAMSPISAAIVLPLGIAVLARSRTMSLMSVTMAPVLAIVSITFAALGWHSWAAATYAVIAAALVVVFHRENIQRLIAGTEPKFGQGGDRRATAASDSPP